MLAALAVSTLCMGVRGTELTPATWDAATSGKSVFVKFQAPWWGHCKSMKPDWDKLMEDFKDSPTALIADVDCTADGKDLCETHGVQGFPTIKYGDPSDLQDYGGGRSYEELKAFADESLGPTCGPGENIVNCDETVKAAIEKYMAMSVGKLEGKIRNVKKAYEQDLPMLKKTLAWAKTQGAEGKAEL